MNIKLRKPDGPKPTLLICVEQGGHAHAVARVCNPALLRTAIDAASEQALALASISPAVVRRRLIADTRELEQLRKSA